MPSNEMEQDGGVWPPNYSNYTNYDTSELGQVLTRESNNETAPKSYREVMSQLEKEFQDLQKKRDATEAKNILYSTYVKAAEDNYNHLAEIYIEEHKIRLNVEEENINIQLKLKQNEEAYDLKEQRIKQQVDQMRSVFTDKFERQKDEFQKTANKQAMGRKNIEEKLMIKEMETMDLKNKLGEVEAQLQAKVKELEMYKVENSQLKLLATYLQNPQQLPTTAQIPPPQQQQQQQQQAPRYQ